MGGGWSGSVILVRHNLSIIPPVEHNFEHNTLVSRVTPESIILFFSSIIRQTLGFLRRFGLKTGTHFAHFGLESAMVFEGTTESRKVFYRFISK